MGIQQPPVDILKEALNLLKILKRMSEDFVKLFLLEARLTIKSLEMISIFFIVMTLLGIFTGFGLMATLVCGLHYLGLNWVMSFLVVTLANGAGCLYCYNCIFKYKENIKFKATRQQLKLKD